VTALLIDYHTHAYPESDDNSLAPNELVAEARRTGLGVICLSDHDAFWVM